MRTFASDDVRVRHDALCHAERCERMRLHARRVRREQYRTRDNACVAIRGRSTTTRRRRDVL